MKTSENRIESFKLLISFDGRPAELPLDGTHEKILRTKTVRKDSGSLSLLTVTLTNLSAKELCFHRAFVRAVFEPGPYEYYAQENRWSMENRGKWAPLDEKGVLLTHKQGRTTEGNTPFCAVRRIGRNAGAAFHILPVGNWRIRILPLIISNTEPKIAVDLGISDEDLAFRLAPGKSWTLPGIIVQQFDDLEGAMPELHEFLKPGTKKLAQKLPVFFNTWFDRFAELDVPHLREELSAAKEIGCEAFVIDAGWFGGDAGWSQVGDWREKQDTAFKGRMKDFADEVRAAGLDFGIWIEPERYVREIPVFQKHPEWFIIAPETGWYRIDLTRQDAYDYLKKEILRLIETYGLKYVKTDMNATLGPDDSGAELYNYQTRFFQLIDELKTLHPETVIEDCSSGALRSDLETLRHFDVFFPSDSVNPYSLLPLIHGFWRRMLPGRIMRWLTFRELQAPVPYFFGQSCIITPVEATWEEYEQCDLESLLIANFTGGALGFSADVASLSKKNRALVRKYVDLFRSRRGFMLNASGRWLEDEPRLQALELENGGNAIVILAYIASDAAPTRTVFPAGLDPKASYRIDGKLRTGKDLMTNGLVFKLEAFQHWKWRAKMAILDKIKK